MVFERRPDLRLLVLNGITFYLFKRVYLVYIFICKTHTHTDACYIYMCVYFSLKEPLINLAGWRGLNTRYCNGTFAEWKGGLLPMQTLYPSNVGMR